MNRLFVIALVVVVPLQAHAVAVTSSDVDEPGTLWLFAAGLLALGMLALRRVSRLR